MSAWTDGYLIANGLRLHYTRTGGDKPPLLLLHGLTDQGLCWAEFARQMEAGYDVIMPDARGHGLSEGDGIELSPDGLVEDVAGLIRGLSLPPVIAMGHSMGGLTAAYLASVHPELVRAIVLEDPALTVQDRPQTDREAWAEQSRLGAAQSLAKSRAEHVEGLLSQNPHWSAEEVERWADARPHVRADTGSLMTISPSVPWREALARITCPVLLLRPDADRAVTGPEAAEEMRRLVPSLEAKHLPGTGHCIRRDQPEEYTRLVQEFLGRVA